MSQSKKPIPSKVDELLASLELDRARTPDELALLAIEIKRAFVGSPELRKMSRPPPRQWKKYIEEVLPLTHLAQHLFPSRQDVLCQPNLSDGENHDATITFPGGTKTFVEFTYAKDGHEDSLRMEVLNSKGRVNMLGEVKHSPIKNRGRQIEVRNEVVPSSRVLEKYRHLIIERLKGKAAKRYGPDHILVVVFDDGFLSDRDVANLKSSVASEIDLFALDFERLYLLGSSGETLSELPLRSLSR